MFDFLKKKTFTPVTSHKLESLGTPGVVTFLDGDRSSTEQFDLVSSLSDTLRGLGIKPTIHGSWLKVDGDIFLMPEMLSAQNSPNGIQIVTVINVCHEKLIPGGLFEYQHALGPTLTETITQGFDDWSKIDFPAIRDAIHNRVETCMAMDFKFDVFRPARRALFGPVASYAKNPAPVDEEHPFCPCCLLTNSLEAFKPLLESVSFFGIRLLAARNSEGVLSADCRVNGVDYEAGKRALIKYASTWPGQGFEFRKQYVVLYS